MFAKMKALRILTFLLLLITLFTWSLQAELLTPDTDTCRLIKDGVKLRKPGTCTESIVCENQQTVNGDVCSGTKPMWDRNTQSCAKSTSDDYCKAPCSKTSATYVADPKSCQGWYECNGAKEVTHGLCATGLYFDAKQQFCVYPSQTSCTAKYDICDVVPKDIKFKDEFNCHKYYTCGTKGITSNVCSDGTYFDLKLGECIAKAQVDCYKHPYPENVCGTIKLAVRGKFVADGATCRGYFFCQDYGTNTPDPEPVWGQCPENLFFDEVENICITRTNLKCNEDRCDGSDNATTISSKPGCQHYLICQDNYTVSEEYCGDGLYFDDIAQKCTSTKTNYAACSV